MANSIDCAIPFTFSISFVCSIQFFDITCSKQVAKSPIPRFFDAYNKLNKKNERLDDKSQNSKVINQQQKGSTNHKTPSEIGEIGLIIPLYIPIPGNICLFLPHRGEGKFQLMSECHIADTA